MYERDRVAIQNLKASAFYSCFVPSFPSFRKPPAPTRTTITVHANNDQNVARKPTRSAAGDDFSVRPDLAVTESEITDVMVNPTEVPS